MGGPSVNASLLVMKSSPQHSLRPKRGSMEDIPTMSDHDNPKTRQGLMSNLSVVNQAAENTEQIFPAAARDVH